MSVDIRPEGDTVQVQTYNPLSQGGRYTFKKTVNGRWKLYKKNKSNDVSSSDITNTVRKAMKNNGYEIGKQTERTVWDKWLQPVAPVKVRGDVFRVESIGDVIDHEFGEMVILETDRGNISVEPSDAEKAEVGKEYYIKDMGSTNSGPISQRKLLFKEVE